MSCPRGTQNPLSHVQINTELKSGFQWPCEERGLLAFGTSKRSKRRRAYGRAEFTGEPFSGVEKATQHSWARSKPLAFSGPTCLGPPGISPRRKPSLPVPQQQQSCTCRERTGWNSALRFPRPPYLPAEVLPTRLWLLTVRLFRHLSLDARIFSFLRVIRHSSLAIESTKASRSFLSLYHPNWPFGAHALLLS